LAILLVLIRGSSRYKQGSSSWRCIFYLTIDRLLRMGRSNGRAHTMDVGAVYWAHWTMNEEVGRLVNEV
jgi:hypothetical protein